jgi:rod shape determining protein RodA
MVLGFLEGTQTKGALFQHTDYIFTTVGEEWGFAGSLVVMALFAGLLLRIIYLAERQKQNSVEFLLVEFYLLLCKYCNGFRHLPTIGVPLPFFSRRIWTLGFYNFTIYFIKMDANKVNEQN